VWPQCPHTAGPVAHFPAAREAPSQAQRAQLSGASRSARAAADRRPGRQRRPFPASRHLPRDADPARQIMWDPASRRAALDWKTRAIEDLTQGRPARPGFVGQRQIGRDEGLFIVTVATGRGSASLHAQGTSLPPDPTTPDHAMSEPQRRYESPHLVTRASSHRSN
jgi:hypothetical protein